MSQNPLQNYFRQPKIYLKLPSLGKYTESSYITGNVENLPVYGMTGMDQIIVKTPDALLNGESTVTIIQSCCPNIMNAWEITSYDVDSLLVAIRIATFGNSLGITTVCNKCKSENTYDIDLSKFVEHYNSVSYDSTVIVDDLVIKLKPLTYRNVTAFGLENFSLQKQLFQLQDVEDDDKKQNLVSKIYKDFALLQNKVLVASIDHVETANGVVNEYGFIKEWVDNCDHNVTAEIKKIMDKNTQAWKVPATSVVCSECGNVHSVDVELDQASFFVNA